MATTDTQLQQLVINVGTDAQITAGIASGTITEDMLSIATDGSDIVYDWVGTLAEYNAQNIATTHPDWLCFITDDVNKSGEDVYDNVYSKTQSDETFVAKVDAVPYLPCLLEFKWSDHILNNTSWLRADTFSWQSGELYEAAYEHLAADIEGKTLQSETISGITISYYLADDGHKICPADQEENIRSLYNATGITWYFIIDTTNTKFKLPRTQFGFVGNSSGVGNNTIRALEGTGYPKITTTNRTSIAVDVNYTLTSDCWVWWGNTSYVGRRYFYVNGIQVGQSYGSSGQWEEFNSMLIPLKAGNVIKHTGSNSTCYIYPTESNIVYNTQSYLYFYVGEFSQDAITNTAGVTTEVLNGKADLVYVDTYKVAKGHEVIAFQAPTSSNSYTWYRKYADGWVEQGGKCSISQDTKTTVTMPIKMTDTNYAVMITPVASIRTGGDGNFTVTRDSQTQFGWCNGDDFSGTGLWEVKGMYA